MLLMQEMEKVKKAKLKKLRKLVEANEQKEKMKLRDQELLRQIDEIKSQ